MSRPNPSHRLSLCCSTISKSEIFSLRGRNCLFVRFMFEKTFATCLTLDHLQGALTADNVYMELLQVGSPIVDHLVCTVFCQETADHQDVVLATFETSARELLFPYPQLRGPYCSGVDVDLLMEPTKDFPGIISPKVSRYPFPGSIMLTFIVC